MSRFALMLGLLTAMALCGCATDMQKNNRALAVYEKGDCKLAVAEWLPLAEQGLATAQNNLGGVFDKGCPSAGVTQDFAQAFHWYSRAAKSGDPMGMRNVGWYYQHGLSVVQNDDAARDWYVIAARWGNEQAKRDLTAMGAPVPPSDLLQQAQEKMAATRQEIFSDTVAVVLGAALGVAASHNQAPSPSTYTGAFSGSVSPSTRPGQNPRALEPNSYRGSFSGSQPIKALAVQQPTSTSKRIYNSSSTMSFRTIGNTTYVTRADGTTSAIVETIGTTKNGHDPNTGRTWTETKIGNSWSGQDSNGKTWMTRQVGDETVTTYSDGTTKTCRVVGDQLSCS